MSLPKKGVVVPIDRLLSICELYGLDDQIAIIENYQPDLPFKSDGASWLPDKPGGVDIYPAAFLHDIKYWAGVKGDHKGRLKADLELAQDVMNLCSGSAALAQLMYAGVRAGGVSWLPTPWKWGFGRQQ